MPIVSYKWIVAASIVTCLAATVQPHHTTGSALRLARRAATRPASVVRIARIFGNGAVLQRDVPMPVWGWATPGARVTVTLGAAKKVTIAQADSAWRVSFPPRGVGQPVTLAAAVDGANESVSDIIFGDVWIASGQSNMEWTLARANNGKAEVAAANDRNLREFKIPNSWSWNAEDELTGGMWNAASPATAGAMSAVAYFFARELRTHINVPIGIINNAWGGAAVAPYISRGAQHLDDAAWATVKNTELQYKARMRDSLEKRLGTLPVADAGLVNGQAVWSAINLDESGWRTIHAPGAWEHNGYAGLDGVAWLRRTFILTAAQARTGAKLALGPIDDDDITWINGVEVGRTEGYFRVREYAVPSSALHEGNNVITVRVTDGTGDGGLTGDTSQLFIESAGAKISLAGDWRFRVGMASFNDDGQHINKIPTILYNRMMHPIAPLPFKGVIWYQGESNSNNDEQAKAYRESFATLIESWRKELNGGRSAFPFLWVQLPNYGKIEAMPPANAGWAYLRESQNAALSLPNTGQAITIDVGEATNLHPTNKRDVGVRLALIARASMYHQPVEFLGPKFGKQQIDGQQIVLTFTNASGLRTRAPGDSIQGFAIAGVDKQWKWARARIVRNTVVVSSDEVMNPVAVRYAWGNSPRNPNLYNNAALPMAPFRTDNW
ncbi:MAG: sialate O-acetylesterase [Gemmatimonadaceae bacterium]